MSTSHFLNILQFRHLVETAAANDSDSCLFHQFGFYETVAPATYLALQAGWYCVQLSILFYQLTQRLIRIVIEQATPTFTSCLRQKSLFNF